MIFPSLCEHREEERKPKADPKDLEMCLKFTKYIIFRLSSFVSCALCITRLHLFFFLSFIALIAVDKTSTRIDFASTQNDTNHKHKLCYSIAARDKVISRISCLHLECSGCLFQTVKRHDAFFCLQTVNLFMLTVLNAFDWYQVIFICRNK